MAYIRLKNCKVMRRYQEYGTIPYRTVQIKNNELKTSRLISLFVCKLFSGVIFFDKFYFYDYDYYYYYDYDCQ